YQQNPMVEGGGFFKIDRFVIVDHHPPLVGRPIRYWDKAGTQDGGCNTAGVKMQKTSDGQFVVLDVVKGQWSALERERRIRLTADLDGQGCDIWTEIEGGSGGKESYEATVRNLSGFNIRGEHPTGDKVTRAEPYAAQVEAG